MPTTPTPAPLPEPPPLPHPDSPDWPPHWPRIAGTPTVPAAQVQTGGAPAWLRELIAAGRGVVWLTRTGGWALSGAEPIPGDGRCDLCRHPYRPLAYVGTDHGVYCGLTCLDAAAHTCPECGGDMRIPSDPALGALACSHGWWS